MLREWPLTQASTVKSELLWPQSERGFAVARIDLQENLECS